MSRQQAAVCIPPRSIDVNPGGANDIKRRMLRAPIAQFSTSAGVTGSQTIYFVAHNPSPRLRCMLGISFELSIGGDFSGGADTPVWSLDNLNLSPEAQAASNFNNIFSSHSIPDAYELDSSTEDIRGTVVLTDKVLATGLQGIVVVTARWVPDVTLDSEIDALLAQIQLKAQTPSGQPLLIRNTS